MSKIIRAAAYARVSTLLLGQDPENQLDPIRQYIKQRGFELVGEYVDRGISGARERRPALDRLVIDVHNRKCDVVIVAALDRLGLKAKKGSPCMYYVYRVFFEERLSLPPSYKKVIRRKDLENEIPPSYEFSLSFPVVAIKEISRRRRI